MFHTNSDDDILFVSSPTVGRAFFRNVGTTRRQGVEVRACGSALTGSAPMPTTPSPTPRSRPRLTLSSVDNPLADAAGNIHVSPGDRLPGVPRQLFKLGADYRITDAWTAGFSALVASGKYLFGDESNLNPTTGAYAVLNLHTAYHVTQNVELFGLVENADQRALCDVRHILSGRSQCAAHPGAGGDQHAQPQPRPAGQRFRRRAGDVLTVTPPAARAPADPAARRRPRHRDT